MQFVCNHSYQHENILLPKDVKNSMNSFITKNMSLKIYRQKCFKHQD
jgi:hypothetical protein